MNSKDFAIGILTTTATILLVGLLVIGSRSQPAMAGAMTDDNGPYVITVSTLTSDDEEVVLVLNAPEEKLIAYRFDAARRELVVLDGIDVAQARAAAAATKAPKAKGANKNKRGRPKRRP
ncbi:MAG: hypothetical protein ACE5E5_04240 [Phycisphaerae bacterium]